MERTKMNYDDEKQRRRDKWNKKTSFKKKFKVKNKSLKPKTQQFKDELDYVESFLNRDDES